MALWSTYMPTGAGTMMLVAALILPVTSWRWVWWLAAAASAVMLLALLLKTLRRPELDPVSAPRRPVLAEMAEVATSGGPLAIAVCFGAYSCCWFTVIGFLPTLQVERLGFSAETAAIVNIDRAREIARALRSMGIRFALDDFGAGFASFYHLKHLAFDHLKIDGEFIRDLPRSKVNQLVVQSVVTIAKGLGKRTIAEFVGDEATFNALCELGVDYAQGFHLCPPAPLENWLGLTSRRPR